MKKSVSQPSRFRLIRFGFQNEALPGGHADTHDDEDVERVHHRADDVIGAGGEAFERDVVIDAVEEEVEGADLEDDEAPPDHRVEDAGVPVPPAGDTGVAEEVGNEAGDAPEEVVEPVDGPTLEDPAQARHGRVDEEGHEPEEDDVVEDVARELVRWGHRRTPLLALMATAALSAQGRPHDSDGPPTGQTVADSEL